MSSQIPVISQSEKPSTSSVNRVGLWAVIFILIAVVSMTLIYMFGQVEDSPLLKTTPVAPAQGAEPSPLPATNM